jgi:hypothetical protein
MNINIGNVLDKECVCACARVRNTTLYTSVLIFFFEILRLAPEILVEVDRCAGTKVLA